MDPNNNAVTTGTNCNRGEAALNYEVVVTVLDLLEDLMTDHYDDFINNSQPGKPHSLIERIFLVLIVVLRSRQSTKLLQHTFAILRSMLIKFRELTFTIHPLFCSLLATEMLRICGYNNYTLKDESSSMLFLLIKVGFCVQVKQNDLPKVNRKTTFHGKLGKGDCPTTISTNGLIIVVEQSAT